jgi:hypothetical protein
MTTIIIIGIIVFIIYVSSGKKKPTLQNTTNINSNNRQKSEKEIHDELAQSLIKNIKVTVTTPSSSNIYNDDSIIDVTNQSHTINLNNSFKIHNEGVVYWKHQYVYSHSEINSASSEQKKFYSIYKNSFLNGEYFDLEGNTNYAFILLFDLLNEFDKHKDIAKLESQLKILGQCYPKTKSYGVSFLIQKMEDNGDINGYLMLQEESIYNDNYWGLGNKYNTELNLTEEEIKFLNIIYYPRNNFSAVRFCFVQILKLFMALISELDSKFSKNTSTMKEVIVHISKIIENERNRYVEDSDNYNEAVQKITGELNVIILKYCENAVREYYGHKRQINTDTYYTTTEAKIEFETKIISNVIELLPVLISNVTLPDEATEIELNYQNTNRWKIKFEELTESYTDKPKEFMDSIITLGNLNKKNSAIKNIFFEASKFTAKYDKESALALYVHYLYHDLKSATFHNKQLTTTVRKNLFKTNEQLHNFEIIVSELIKDKNLDKALKNVSKVYEIKRKKIRLNTALIKEVQKQHSGTVELLNEYLKDDFEDKKNPTKSQEMSNEEIKIEIKLKSDDRSHSAFVGDLNFTAIHISALELFPNSNFSVSQIELEQFAKSKGIFKNQLIESINEICYEFLDDVLIEEEEDFYTINTNYFKRITAKC